LPTFRLTLQVTDVLTARIRACAARPGLAKCGWGRRGSEPQTTDLADRTPRARTAPAAVTVCYVLVFCFISQ